MPQLGFDRTPNRSAGDEVGESPGDVARKGAADDRNDSGRAWCCSETTRVDAGAGADDGPGGAQPREQSTCETGRNAGAAVIVAERRRSLLGMPAGRRRGALRRLSNVAVRSMRRDRAPAEDVQRP